MHTKQKYSARILSKPFSSEIPKSEEDFTESGSTKKMLMQMLNPLSPRSEPSLKKVKSQEQEESVDKPVHEVEKIEEDQMQEEHKFNPTPFSISYDPYK